MEELRGVKVTYIYHHNNTTISLGSIESNESSDRSFPSRHFQDRTDRESHFQLTSDQCYIVYSISSFVSFDREEAIVVEET